MLRLKAFIYRYFNVFLAYEEEIDYLQSEEFWFQFWKIYDSPKNDMTAQDIQGLLIGLWEADHGFARPMNLLRYKSPSVVFSVIAWFVDLFTAIRWDIRDFTRKICKK